jgi:hypothetical protein
MTNREQCGLAWVARLWVGLELWVGCISGKSWRKTKGWEDSSVGLMEVSWPRCEARASVLEWWRGGVVAWVEMWVCG